MHQTYPQNRDLNRTSEQHTGIYNRVIHKAYVLPVCYLPRHSRLTQIYLKQEGNPPTNHGNTVTRCLPQGINNCPQQQWLAYLVQIFITLFLKTGPHAGRGRLILLALITIGVSHILEHLTTVPKIQKKDNVCQMETYRATYVTMRRTRLGRPSRPSQKKISANIFKLYKSFSENPKGVL